MELCQSGFTETKITVLQTYVRGSGRMERCDVKSKSAVSQTSEMIRGMNPTLKPGKFVFCTLPAGLRPDELHEQAIATFREDEGLSLLLPEETATAYGLRASEPMRQITLLVYSSLTGVGLTAAVATALGAASVPCNMIAATLHDHVFVPADMAEAALEVLKRLESQGS